MAVAECQYHYSTVHRYAFVAIHNGFLHIGQSRKWLSTKPFSCFYASRVICITFFIRRNVLSVCNIQALVHFSVVLCKSCFDSLLLRFWLNLTNSSIRVTHTHTHTRTHAHTHARTHARAHARTHARARARTRAFNGPFSGTTRVSRYQKGKTNLDFNEARDSGSGISWVICKFAPRSRQISR